MIRPMGMAVGGTALRRLLRVAGAVAAGLALIGVVAYLVGHVGLTSRHSGVEEAAASSRSNVVRLHWRADQLRPAPTPGHICVTDTTYGTICARFAPGERPADSLRREAARLGLRVEGSLVGR
jgi:hypothetical protein